jgi:hypothetical protein
VFHLLDVRPFFEPDRLATPIVVDAVRDYWDYAVMISGFASLAIGLIALYLARRSQATADEALLREAEAETRAVERAARERRTTFELEVLRSLLKDLDLIDADDLRRLAFRPEQIIEWRFGSYLALLPAEDLALWRTWPNLSPEQREELVSEVDPDEYLYARLFRHDEESYPESIVRALFTRLRRDVIIAVQRRMVAPHESPANSPRSSASQLSPLSSVSPN